MTMTGTQTRTINVRTHTGIVTLTRTSKPGDLTRYDVTRDGTLLGTLERGGVPVAWYAYPADSYLGTGHATRADALDDLI